MLLSLPILLPFVLEKLQQALGPHLPVHVHADALHLTIGSQNFRVVTLPLPTPDTHPIKVIDAGPRPMAPLPTIAVATAIPSSMAQRLRNQGQPYADAIGNVWVESEPLAIHLLVMGARPRKLRLTNGAALQLQGLRLLFRLLVEPARAQGSNLAIARHAGLALPFANDALLDLEQSGFLVAENGRHLVNLPELTARWATAYGHTMRPQLLAQRYRWVSSQRLTPNWSALARATDSWLGGAVAARQLVACTLTPTTFTLYTYSNATPGLLLKAGLEPHPDGPVEVVRLFAVPTVFPREHCVHPLILYGDLLAAGDEESRRVAHHLLGQHLPHLVS